MGDDEKEKDDFELEDDYFKRGTSTGDLEKRKSSEPPEKTKTKQEGNQ